MITAAWLKICENSNQIHTLQEQMKTEVQNVQTMVEKLKEAEKKRQEQFEDLEALLAQVNRNNKKLLNPYRQKKSEEDAEWEKYGKDIAGK